jgi:hypothetical protein
MSTTYRFGYGSLRLALDQLEQRRTWADLHPEIRRRLIRMFDVARAEGHDLGIGEGARDPARQEAEFFRRHVPVNTGGCCSYKGKRWALKAGMAPIAPPGNSNHEKGILDGYAMAADLVGWEDHWFDANCHRFGLKNFGGAIGPGVNGEEWHAQPVEFANSRSAVNAQVAAGLTLTAIPLPGDPLTPPTPEPPDPLPQEIPPMLFIAKPTFPGATASDPWIVYYENPGSSPRAERATNAHVKAAVILGVPVVDQDSADQYLDARQRYGI